MDPADGYDPNYYIAPFKAPWCNRTMYGPPGSDVEPLEVCVTEIDGKVATASAWEVNEEQRAMLEAGATIRLTVWQHPIPPLALGIEPPWCHECSMHQWFDYGRREFVCNCEGLEDPDAEDDPDIARRAAPEDILCDFSAAPNDEDDDLAVGGGGQGNL